MSVGVTDNYVSTGPCPCTNGMERHHGPAGALALHVLPLRREGTLGARLETRPARATRPASGAALRTGCLAERAAPAAAPRARRPADRRLDGDHRRARGFQARAAALSERR